MYVEIDAEFNGPAHDWVKSELGIPAEKIYAVTPDNNGKKTFWRFDDQDDAMAFKLRWG